jgi:LysR family transcriptional regulator, cyn operon transcriptional activator
MDIRQLTYFVDLAHTQHVGKSAARLFVTQSTLSHGLRQLEEDIGLQLFERVGRNIQLATSGKLFLAFASRALAELESGRMAMSDLSELKTGALRIGVIPTFLNELVAQAVAHFSERYQGISVAIESLRADEIERLLSEGRLDVGIAFFPAAREGIETDVLFGEKLLAVCAKTNMLSARNTISFRELAKHRLALLPQTYSTRRLIDSGFEKHGLKPRVCVQMESINGLLSACSKSTLVTVVPERAVAKSPHLHVLALTNPALLRQAGILWRKGASKSLAALTFVDVLKKCAPK